MTDENDFRRCGDDDGESAESYDVRARHIIWPSGVSLPTAARVKVPGWLDGRSHVSSGPSDWHWATVSALEEKFGHRPISINVPPAGSSLGLYYIAATPWTDNLDLFAWATDPDDAVATWTDYYDLPEEERPDRVFFIPTNVPSYSEPLAWRTDVQERHPKF